MSDPVTSPTPRRKPPPLLPVLLTAALAAACGGPAATLHDVLDEAEDRVNHVLAAFDETEGEMSEVIGAELPACPPHYEPPPLSTGPPPYEDVVERPAQLGDPAEERNLVRTHARHCRESGSSLQRLQTVRQQLRGAYEGFAGHAQAMRDFIDDDMTNEQLETLSAEVEAVAAARPDEEDTLQQRYERLNGWIIQRSPLVREMALVAGLLMPVLPKAEQLDGLVAEFVGEWTTILDNHTAARAFFRMRNDYRRRTYEGPDAVDPDEAAANWAPLAGVWSGEYASSSSRRRPNTIEITFDGDGATVSYPTANCRGSLRLTSTSGASGRLTEYHEELRGRGCDTDGTVTLERTAEDRIRFNWRKGSREYEGNLTQQ